MKKMAGKKEKFETFGEKYAVPKAAMEGLENVSWMAIANLANEFRIKAKKKSVEMKNLEKKLHLNRMVIAHCLEEAHEGEHGFDAKFFTRLVRLLGETERLSRKHGADLGEFSKFLLVLIEKMKKEKLVCFEGPEGKFVSVGRPKGDFWHCKGG